MSEDLYYTSGAGPSASASSRFERNRVAETYESSGALGIILFIRSQKTLVTLTIPQFRYLRMQIITASRIVSSSLTSTLVQVCSSS